MAPKPKEPQPDINEEVRQGLRGGIRALLLLVPIIALGWLLYVLFFSSSLRDQHTTVDATVAAYTELVRPYLGAGGSRPNPIVVGEFLSFFDSDSGRFFNDNADAIAARRFQFERERFDALSSGERRVEAMLALVNRAPLNGMSGVLEQRPLDGGRYEVRVGVVGGPPRMVVFRPSGKTFVMENMGGLRGEIEAELPAPAATP